MTTLAVVPASWEMASTETLPLGFTTTPLLGAGETPSSPSVLLVDLYSGQPHAGGLSGSPSVSGNVITQTVTKLQAQHQYRLLVTFTAAAGKVWTMELILDCVF